MANNINQVNKKVLIVEDQFVEANDLQLMLTKAGYEVTGIARSVTIAEEMIKKEKPGLVLLDIFLKGKLTGVDLAKQLRDDNIAFIYLSANSNEEILSQAKLTEPYGFIVKPFREKDLLVTLEIARYRHEHSRESKYRREVELIRQLEKTVSQTTDWKQQLLHIGKTLQPYIPFDFMAAGFDDPDSILHHALAFFRIGFDEYQALGLKELSLMTGSSPEKLIAMQAASVQQLTPAFFNAPVFTQVHPTNSLNGLFGKLFSLRSLLILPLQLPRGQVFSFCFYSKRPDAYNAEQLATVQHLQQTLRSLVEQMGVTQPTAFFPAFSNKGAAAITIAKEKAEPAPAFEGIIGNSHLLLNVFDQVTQVAPFDTSVLILGESGTGKERIAECLHELSPRKKNPLVKLNCAALPATLIESELFGHEKGSFTGATDKRIGKFEQANGGTIFLDEIGEMPVDLQVKLLRVLQQKEIEPIGGRTSIKIDVRIIAATNRNLEKEVAEGRFRLDLYYRLNVFPIELPGLRERSDDIPGLVDHFIQHYNRKTGKKVTGVTDSVLKNLMAYEWPGNIRELENLVERSVLLAKGPIIEEMAIWSGQKKNVASQANQAKTIHENERDFIIAVLVKCAGRIWGAGGAAEILSIPPTTLASKMKKLGIQKEHYTAL